MSNITAILQNEQLTDDQLWTLMIESVKDKARRFLALVEADDSIGILAQRTAPEDRTVFKHRHKGYKKKGGSPPVDYLFAEAKADLAIALKGQDPDAILSAYHSLRRLIES